MIISLVNQKGGVGKTTIAVNLASCLSEKGYRLLLVDADPLAPAGVARRRRVEEVSWSLTSRCALSK